MGTLCPYRILILSLSFTEHWSKLSQETSRCSTKISNEFIHLSAAETYCERLKAEPALAQPPLPIASVDKKVLEWSEPVRYRSGLKSNRHRRWYRFFRCLVHGTLPLYGCIDPTRRFRSLDFMACLCKRCSLSWPIEKDIEIGSQSSFMSLPVGIASGALSLISGKEISNGCR